MPMGGGLGSSKSSGSSSKSKGGGYGNSPGEGGGKFGGSGLGSSSSSKGGRVGSGSTSSKSSSKSYGGSGDTGRYGGGTKGTAGAGFGGKAGGQYGGSKSTASQSKGGTAGRVGSGAYGGGAGPGRGPSAGGPSLGKSTSSVSKGGGFSPTGLAAGRAAERSTPTASPGYGWGGKGGRVGTGPYGGGAGAGRGPSIGGPSLSAPSTRSVTAPSTVGAGRGIGPQGPTTSWGRELAASAPAATGKADRVTSTVGAGRGKGLQGPSLTEAQDRLAAAQAVDRQIAGYTQYGQTRERQRLATVDRLANERRTDLATLGRASNQYSEALGAADKQALKESYRDAIAGRETEGVANPYGAKHADVKRKDGSITNAYGKYGVMEDNIGPWTQEVLGKALTVEQFRNDPKAQDAVFDAKFGGYVDKYGSFEKAAQAWYGGPGAVGKPSRGPRAGNPGPTVGAYAADAVGRQINAYNDRTTAARSQIAQTTTGVTGVPATAATQPRTSIPSSVANREQTAERAARAAYNAAIADAKAQGLDPNDPVVDSAAQTAMVAAYNRSFNAEASTAPAQSARPAAAATAPASTQTVSTTTTKTSPYSTTNPNPNYQRSLPRQLGAAGIDVLMGSNPVTLAANLVSLLTTGNTVGGFVMDASGGKYGPNQYQPGGPQSPGSGYRAGSSGGDGSREYPTATRTTPEQAAEAVEESAEATTPAETFVAKYIDPPKEPPREAIPEPVYDWTPKQHSPLGRFSWEV